MPMDQEQARKVISSGSYYSGNMDRKPASTSQVNWGKEGKIKGIRPVFETRYNEPDQDLINPEKSPVGASAQPKPVALGGLPQAPASKPRVGIRPVPPGQMPINGSVLSGPGAVQAFRDSPSSGGVIKTGGKTHPDINSPSQSVLMDTRGKSPPSGGTSGGTISANGQVIKKIAPGAPTAGTSGGTISRGGQVIKAVPPRPAVPPAPQQTERANPLTGDRPSLPPGQSQPIAPGRALGASLRPPGSAPSGQDISEANPLETEGDEDEDDADDAAAAPISPVTSIYDDFRNRVFGGKSAAKVQQRKPGLRPVA